MGAFEQAWQFLKADFSDIAPFPTRYKMVPEGVPFHPLTEEQKSQRLNFFARDPQTNQRYMEEDYIPDLQEMLELEAIRQASGQEVPRFLLRAPHMGGGAVGIPYPPGSGRSVYDYRTGPRMMRNVPSRMQNLPLTTRPHTVKDISDSMNFTARVPNQFASVQSMNNEE